MSRDGMVFIMSSQIRKIRKTGEIGEIIATDDFHEQGFLTYKSVKPGYDFIGILHDSQNRAVQVYFVEVKKIQGSTKRPISKTQESFRKLCKLTHVDHLIYYVTEDRIDQWLSEHYVMTLDQFIDSEDGAI